MFTSSITIYLINSCVVACQFAIGISQRNYEPLQYHITWHHMTSCDIVSQFMLTFVTYHYHGRRRWRVQQTSMLKYTSLANIHTLSNTRPTGAKMHMVPLQRLFSTVFACTFSVSSPSWYIWSMLSNCLRASSGNTWWTVRRQAATTVPSIASRQPV